MFHLWDSSYSVKNNSSPPKTLLNSNIGKRGVSSSIPNMATVLYLGSYLALVKTVYSRWSQVLIGIVQRTENLAMVHIHVPLEIWAELESQQAFKASSLLQRTPIHHDWGKFRVCLVMTEHYQFGFGAIECYKPISPHCSH